ncbi:hypothetical protein [Streptomyces griseosporeus]|uniref:hypothetical protein n=1 Tax=Streptomyces griseosporeus TaxID=1910 RepID=UPI00167DA6FE|nr:hypothetical protein [Streptomyces griseosporeus]GHF59488.1 hypothetical protein GCM10018783_30400 [Streptomyces griseosporeus]
MPTLSRIPPRLRLPLAGALALTVAAAVGVTLLTRDDDGGHRAANAAQLKRACGGLLPYADLRDRVPDDVRGELDEYGTLLDPGQESRSLLNCTLDWKDRGGLHVEATTLVNRLPFEVKTEDLLTPGHEAPGVTGRLADDKRLWIVAECPNGITGRARKATQLYVGVGVEKASARAEFRVAVAVANGIASRAHCGTAPAALPTRVIDTYEEHDAAGGPVDSGDYDDIRVDEPGRGVRKCAWSAAKGSAPLPGTWTVTGDLQDSRLLSVCGGERRTDPGGGLADPQPADLEPLAFDTASWAGELGAEAYRDYREEGRSPGFDDRSDNTLTEEDAALALWARSECAAGTTYHRVSIRPNLAHLADPELGGHTLTRAERAGLSRAVSRLMTGYLTAPDGWPKAQHCHDTKLLGEVEEWR